MRFLLKIDILIYKFYFYTKNESKKKRKTNFIYRKTAKNWLIKLFIHVKTITKSRIFLRNKRRRKLYENKPYRFNLEYKRLIKLEQKNIEKLIAIRLIHLWKLLKIFRLQIK